MGRRGGAGRAGPGPEPAGRGLAFGLVAAAAAAAVLYLALVRVPLGTVVAEETLFRGVLLGLGRRRWSAGAAAAVSSAAFGLWHLLPARQVTSFNPVTDALAGDPLTRALGVAAAVGGTALAGLVFCWLRLHSGSLLAPALAHWASNGLGYALAFAVLGAR